jgi:hypothetical protein
VDADLGVSLGIIKNRYFKNRRTFSRLEVITAMKIYLEVFWAVIPHTISSEHLAASTFMPNVMKSEITVRSKYMIACKCKGKKYTCASKDLGQ